MTEYENAIAPHGDHFFYVSKIQFRFQNIDTDLGYSYPLLFIIFIIYNMYKLVRNHLKQHNGISDNNYLRDKILIYYWI